MLIKPFPSGPFDTNAYVVADPETGKAAIVDPAPDSAQPLINYLTEHQLTPVIILLTHSHWDHIADTAEIKRLTHAPVYIHPLDTGNLEHPGSDGLPCWIQIEGVTPDKTIIEGDSIQIGNLTFKVIHTPGHTPGGVCFYNKNENTLLSGDTLFKRSIGNLSFSTANADDMWTSLDKLAKLPPETKVYPGHGPSTTIGAEYWLPRAKEFFNY